MTLNKLLKVLTKLSDQGMGKCQVVVDKQSLWDGNGTFNVCEVDGASSIIMNICDGDGFHIENKRGGERLRDAICIYGKYPSFKQKSVQP